MYRFSVNDLPAVFKEYFTKRSVIHDYPTRHINDLNITCNEKSFSDHAIRTSGSILWNSLTKTLKESKTIRHSEINSKKHLFKIMIKLFLSIYSPIWSSFSWCQFVLFIFFFVFYYEKIRLKVL